MTVLCYDVVRDKELEARGGRVSYVDSLDEVWSRADIISLHSPLLPTTRHMINDESIARMRPGVMLINTSRGGLIDTHALIRGLKSGKIGAAGLDVYEQERGYFFENWAESVISDDLLTRLMTFNNVIITGHQVGIHFQNTMSVSPLSLGILHERGSRRNRPNNPRQLHRIHWRKAHDGTQKRCNHTVING